MSDAASTTAALRLRVRWRYTVGQNLRRRTVATVAVITVATVARFNRFQAQAATTLTASAAART